MPLLDRPKNWPAHLPWAYPTNTGPHVMEPMPRGEVHDVPIGVVCTRQEASANIYDWLTQLQDALAQRLTVEFGWKELAESRAQTIEALQAQIDMLGEQLDEHLDGQQSPQAARESTGIENTQSATGQPEDAGSNPAGRTNRRANAVKALARMLDELPDAGPLTAHQQAVIAAFLDEVGHG